MVISTISRYWAVWTAASLLVAGILAYIVFAADDKTVFMPGPLSDGHHQFVDNCQVCHGEGFSDGEAMQEKCVDCHGDQRVKPFDSHPRSKFTDPRNADRLEAIDALHCVTCHTEHRPEITLANGLTQPKDVCFHCHSDIGEERPSHQGMGLDTCATAGCHNFHNNRALYTDFLVKHMDAPPHKERAKVPGREFADVLDEILEYPRDAYPIEAIDVADMDAPDGVQADPAIVTEWHDTAHAQAGVNCSACHQPANEQGERGTWQDKPGVEGCQSCHNIEVDLFKRGKHGMRLAAGLPPMQVANARLPMHEDAAHAALTCGSCHGAHRFDVAYAAVEGCLQCHADEHSLAFEGSPHHKLWQQEISGDGKKNSGVSCATCHMPRIDYDVNDWMSRKVVDHNQSATLSPNSKMIRPACLHCHGLGFAIDALADQTLIDNNFRGAPSVHVDSIDLAREDQERYLREKAEAGL